jgi:hypothetical protein
METLKTGDYAYADCFIAGLVPCQVTKITGLSGMPSTAQVITVRFTVSKNGYRKGETQEFSGLRVIPRGSLRYRSGQARIMAYEVHIG